MYLFIIVPVSPFHVLFWVDRGRNNSFLGQNCLFPPRQYLRQGILTFDVLVLLNLVLECNYCYTITCK